jgi:hypothetical protein
MGRFPDPVRVGLDASEKHHGGIIQRREIPYSGSMLHPEYRCLVKADDIYNIYAFYMKII